MPEHAIPQVGQYWSAGPQQQAEMIKSAQKAANSTRMKQIVHMHPAPTVPPNEVPACPPECVLVEPLV